MSIIGWIVIGGLVGWIASIIMGRNRQQGCIGNILVGIVGAVLGGLGYNLLTGQGLSFNFSSFDITSLTGFLVALAGAIVLLVIVGWFQKR